MNRGVVYAAGAYVIWGLLPIFWKALGHVPADEILAHRVVWAVLVAFVLVATRGKWAWLPAVAHNRRTVLTFIATAALISVNWFIFIWAVNNGHIVETSLGYFINPLVNVLLGLVFLRERLRFGQGIAVAVAAGGVVYLTIQYGALPWIALGLAVSFGLYGLLRKTATLNSLQGFTVETMLLFLPALGYLIWKETQVGQAFGHTGVPTALLLALCGVVTAIPLLLFAEGARRITFTTLGILQYIAPTLQLLLGVLVYGEALPTTRLYGFILIWLALVMYSVEGAVQRGRIARVQTA